MLRGIFTKLFQSCFITLCIIRYRERNITAAQIITAQRDIVSVAVIFIVLCLFVQVIIQNLQVIADTVQFLIINIPQVIRGSGKGISRAIGILQIRTDTFGQRRCLSAVIAEIFLCRIQHIQELICLCVQFFQFITEILDLQKRLHLAYDAADVFSALNEACIGTILQIALMQSAYDTSGIVTHMLIANGSGIGAVIDLTIRGACDTAGIRMRSHIGSTVDLLQIFHGNIIQIIGHFRAIGIDAATVAAVI